MSVEAAGGTTATEHGRCTASLRGFRQAQLQPSLGMRPERTPSIVLTTAPLATSTTLTSSAQLQASSEPSCDSRAAPPVKKASSLFRTR